MTGLRYVEVAVAAGAGLPRRAGGGLPGLYSYHLPDGLECEIGQLVEVPFGPRRLIGLVAGWPAAPDLETRPVGRKLGDEPIVSTVAVDLARFVARTYRAPLFECLCLVLPPGFAARQAKTLSDGFWSPPRFRAPPPEPAPTGPPGSPPRLTIAQLTAREEILRAYRDFRPDVFLLHGVTGSGKTLAYQEAVAEIVADGGQAIILVSEIGLTPELVGRFRDRFPGRTVVLHSGLTAAEHFRNWLAVQDGQAQVVVGARSALFAPASRLGLVVLDEEHEWSYKQDSTPRYHAREVAIELGRLSRRPVVLSSATPDVVTSCRARTGEIRQLFLPGRYVRRTAAESGARQGRDDFDSRAQPAGPVHSVEPTEHGQALPTVRVVDLRAELRTGNVSIFSRALRQELGATLDRGEQAILFINRRGANTCVTCRQCGHVVSCRRCDVPLVYHRATDALVCHRCNRRRPPMERCPACGGNAIRHFGVGTQRVEQELRTSFPTARVLRWDRDTIRAGGGHDEIWEAFRQHRADLLIGTQMVAKGLDFAGVTLVGVLLADVGLFLPDFRAAERSFQLLTQVAGRAGRRERPGRVIVQTYSPDHAAIRCAAAHDYDAFYEQEIGFRREQGYPPFGRLVRFVYSASDERRCWREAGRLRRALHERIETLADPELRLIGPAPCYAQRVRGRFRWQIVVRGEQLEPLLDGLVLPPGWIIDVDPVNLL